MQERSTNAATRADGGGRVPRVSIGLPVHNGERFIGETLDSLLAQSFDDFEIIISDNASGDATERIARGYAERDRRITYFRTARNVGAARNFNRVVDLASGDYFKWMAADDVCGRDFLRRCVDVLDSRPEAVLAYPRAAFIDESGSVLYAFDEVMRIRPWPAAPVPRTRQMIDAIMRDGVAANVTVFGVMRRAALGAHPLGNYFGADLPLVTRLALEGEIHEVPQVLAFYRRHEGSSSAYRRSPDAARQQEFFDPSIRGRLRQEFQLRRRYPEIFRTVVRSRLDARDRARLAYATAAAIGRRTRWRIGFELRSALGRDGEGGAGGESDRARPHWTEYA